MTDDDTNVKEQSSEQAGEAGQTTIRWDGTDMRSTYANICNVSSSREEVTLLFGTNKNWHGGQQEITVELSDRLLLSPYTAKRLALLLTGTIEEYEKRFGELKLDGVEKQEE